MSFSKTEDTIIKSAIMVSETNYQLAFDNATMLIKEHRFTILKIKINHKKLRKQVQNRWYSKLKFEEEVCTKLLGSESGYKNGKNHFRKKGKRQELII